MTDWEEIPSVYPFLGISFSSHSIGSGGRVSVVNTVYSADELNYNNS